MHERSIARPVESHTLTPPTSRVDHIQERIKELEQAGEALKSTSVERDFATQELWASNEKLKTDVEDRDTLIMEFAEENQLLNEHLIARTQEVDLVIGTCSKLKKQLDEQSRQFQTRLSEAIQQRGMAVQAMVDEGQGLQSRITELQDENRVLTEDLAKASAESAKAAEAAEAATAAPRGDSCCHSCGSSIGTTLSISTTLSSSHSIGSSPGTPSAGSPDPSDCRAMRKICDGEPVSRSARGSRQEAEEDALLLRETIQLLEHELNIKDQQLRLCAEEALVLRRRARRTPGGGLPLA